MERMLIGRLLAGAAVCSALTGLGGTEWKRNAGTLTRDAQDTHGGEPSYVMETKSVGDVAEIARRFDCVETNCLPAAWSVWCKVEAQKLVNVDIHIHFQFADGSWRWWVRRNYSWWEPGWHRIAGTFNPGKKPIAKVQCYAQVSRGAAKVKFADFNFERRELTPEILSVAPIMNRPFADTVQLDIDFSKSLSWSAQLPDGSVAKGKGDKASFAVPSSAKTVPMTLSDGKTEVKVDAAVPDLAKCPLRPGRNPLGADEVRVWTADSMRRISPLTFPSAEELAEGACAVDVELARHERESAQIVVSTGDERELAGCTVELSPLKRTDGTPFKGGWKWQRVGFVPRRPGYNPHPEAPSPLERWIPDPLLPAADFRVRRGASQAVWLTAYADPGAVPGAYRGTAAVKCGGRTLATVPVTVRVRGFALPKTFGMETAYCLMHSWIKSYYPEAFRAKLREAQDLMLDCRLNPDDISRYEPPYIDDLLHARERGMNRFNCMNVLPERGPGENKLSWKCFPSEKEVQEPDFVSNFIGRLKPFVAELKRHGLEKYAYVYGYDERGGTVYTNSIAQVWRAMKAETPGIPLQTTSTLFGDYVKLYRKLKRDNAAFPWDAVLTDWFCPLTEAYDPGFADELRKRGKRVWWYTCCSPNYPYANQASVEFPLVEGRLLGWMLHRYRSDGWLFWHVNIWASPKMDEGDTFFPDFRYQSVGTPGDGVFLYPGREHILDSMRIAQVRDSVEDCEWLQMLSAKRGKAEADALSDRLFRSMTDFTRDPRLIRATRRELGDRID